MLIDFFISHWHETLQLIGEHLLLVLISTSLAVLIGFPLGIAMTRYHFLQKPILNTTNVLQTIPSLALFGFLIPISGIGPQTAIAALLLYSLLPIIQNTFSGIESVDPSIREAGKAMGMTDKQILFHVEIPLALSLIIAGIRIATVISVGTATIAAVIDAGGLGRYIFRGLRMNDNTLLLAGAIPAALIAIGANFFFEWLEKCLKKDRKYGKYFLSIFTLFLIPIFINIPDKTEKKVITIGSKDFTEQLILGEILAQEIEAKTDLKVLRSFDLGGELAHRALLSGKIDAYIEYTGTALTSILHLPKISDPVKVYDKVSDIYPKKFGLIWGKPLGFANSFAVIVKRSDAEKYHLAKISDLIPHASQMVAGFGQDFLSRPDGYEGFVKTYGLHFNRVREMDLSLTYRALIHNKVDVIIGNSTDGLIGEFDLRVLEDDLHYFPPYDAAPVVRKETYPKIQEALDGLAGKISEEEIRHLNYLVDAEHKLPEEVAKEFLLKMRTLD